MENPENGQNKRESAIGFSQMLLGIGTIIISTLAPWFTALILGFALGIRGVLDIYKGIQPYREGAGPLRGRIMIGAFTLLLSLLLFFFPQTGASVFAIALAILFIVAGVQKIISPLSERKPYDKFTVMSGVISFLLGVILIISWPVESFSILGVFAGIEILLNGMTVSIATRAAGGIRKDFPGRQSKV